MRCEVGSDDNEIIELSGDAFVPHGHLIDVGFETIAWGCLFEIFVGDMVIIEFGTLTRAFFCCPS